MNSSQAERLQWITLTVLGLVAGLAIALPLGVPIFAIAGAMVGTPIVLSIVGLPHGPLVLQLLEPWLADRSDLRSGSFCAATHPTASIGSG
ncbi:MAG: hypothetical protein DMG53_10865 [Acidobacteria bacterium]|nr:MAG: hypothetical protein DMG53_10865 [Acidobacteriota bacterium]